MRCIWPDVSKLLANDFWYMTPCCCVSIGCKVSMPKPELHHVSLRGWCCRQRVLGENSLEVATTWLNLGGVLRAAGKLEEAESACRQCLDIRERQLGSQHSDTAAAQIGEPWHAPAPS